MVEERTKDGARGGGSAPAGGGARRRGELPRWARRALGVLLGVAILGGLVLAFLPSPVPVDTQTVRSGTMEVAVEEDGRTRLRHDYVVSAPVAGTLARVTLRPGDPVEVGDELTRLRPSPAPLLDARAQAQAQAALEGARARLEQARAQEERAEAATVEAREELRRQRVLLEESGGSRSALERAEAGVRAMEAEASAARSGIRAAEHEVEQARLAAARVGEDPTGEPVPLRSPVTGRVLEVMQESEGTVQPGTPIMRVGDPADLELVVDLLSADAVRVEPGARARIERWGEDEALAARVRVVEPSGFTRVSALGIEEQRVNVVLDLVDPPDRWRALGDGYRIEARIVVWEEEGVTIVPASAVFRTDDGWAAFRVEGGRARLVLVEVGRRSDVEVQVLSGLEEGDEVITYPGDRVEDGVRVDRR